MIPVSLRMRNFMPYRGEACFLSFAQVHIACITGDNGAGKSSIIDAITWALWGKSRAKSEDDLIHQSETSTEVEFQFRACEHLYRVVRRHSRPKNSRLSGASSLDLYLDSEIGPVTLSAERISQTEDKIKSILKMDYETFINSAFVRQGHADEFTQQSPAKRKEVLANILGLDIYDKYEAIAKDKSKREQDQKLTLSSIIGEMEKETSRKATLVENLKTTEDDLNSLITATQIAEDVVKNKRQDVQILNEKQTGLAKTKTTIARHQEDLRREKIRLQTVTQRIADYHTLLKQKKEIDSSYELLQKSRQQYEEMSQKARKYTEIVKKRLPLESAINVAKDRLETNIAAQEKELENIKTKVDGIPALLQEQQTLTEARKKRNYAEQELDAKRRVLSSAREKLSSLSTENKQADLVVQQIEEKERMLEGDKSTAHCPLCLQSLQGRQLENIRNQYTLEKQQKHDLLHLNESAIKILLPAIEENETSIKQMEKQIGQEGTSLDRQEERLEIALQEANDARSIIAETQTQIDKQKGDLKNNLYAISERETLLSLETEAVSLAYDENRHQVLEQEIRKLKGIEGQKAKLEEAEKGLPQEKESKANCLETISNIEERFAEDTKNEKDLERQLEQLPQLKNELQQCEESMRQQEKKRDDSREKVAGLRRDYERLREMDSSLAEKRRELEQVAENESIFKLLTQLFGKKGLQAMLIETAIPEIEAEANRLLGRMTDGRMTLAFETQQATKKGTVSETLEIKIADELGTRSYEMFSGGERFRIDFAVRIALSRMLARRAGAPLPTIIIDEGFGTQDNDGIEKLKEAINSIQDDFQMILVVTHIEELKEAFPIRINVSKSTESSKIDVSLA
ncbi:MAG: SMC family ATPase [Dehalococcoidia bacterium]|nr:SMC family ATPase [Dehalococcoidia bacterium]